jgi:hypothetical protein
VDQAHDVVGYFQRGIEGETKGRVWSVVEPHRGLAVFNGWAKDEPFTAIVFVDFASAITDEDLALAKAQLELLDQQPTEATTWR